MSICNQIYDNIFVDCNFPEKKDQSTVYLINYDDIAYVEFDGYPAQEIRTIEEHRDIIMIYLKAGTYVYSFEGKQESVDCGHYAYELLYSDVFAHWVNMRVFSNDSETKEILEKLPKGKYVLIYNNVVYGLYSGMVLMSKEKSSEDNNKFTYYFLEFETDVEATEPHMPNVYLGDLEWLMTDHWILWDAKWDMTGIWMNDQIWN